MPVKAYFVQINVFYLKVKFQAKVKMNSRFQAELSLWEVGQETLNTEYIYLKQLFSSGFV